MRLCWILRVVEAELSRAISWAGSGVQGQIHRHVHRLNKANNNNRGDHQTGFFIGIQNSRQIGMPPLYQRQREKGKGGDHEPALVLYFSTGNASRAIRASSYICRFLPTDISGFLILTGSSSSSRPGGAGLVGSRPLDGRCLGCSLGRLTDVGSSN